MPRHHRVLSCSAGRRPRGTAWEPIGAGPGRGSRPPGLLTAAATDTPASRPPPAEQTAELRTERQPLPGSEGNLSGCNGSCAGHQVPQHWFGSVRGPRECIVTISFGL